MVKIKTRATKRRLFTSAHAYAKRVLGYRKGLRRVQPLTYREAFAEALREGYRAFQAVNARGYTSRAYRNFYGNERIVGEGIRPRPVTATPADAALLFEV